MKGIFLGATYAGVYTYQRWCVQLGGRNRHIHTTYTFMPGLDNPNLKLESVEVEECSCDIRAVPDEVIRKARIQSGGR